MLSTRVGVSRATYAELQIQDKQYQWTGTSDSVAQCSSRSSAHFVGLICLRGEFNVPCAQHAVVGATRSYIAHGTIRVHKLALTDQVVLAMCV